MWLKCCELECDNEAVVVRHYSTRHKEERIADGAMKCESHVWCASCAKHLANPDLHADGSARSSPIVHVTPGSPEHVALDCAFHTLAHGLYAPAELQQMNDNLRALHRHDAATSKEETP